MECVWCGNTNPDQLWEVGGDADGNDGEWVCVDTHACETHADVHLDISLIVPWDRE